jgi:dolichol-phosphate mannosyltransferase
LKLSVLIPAHNEAESIGSTVAGLVAALEREAIDYEVLVVDDGSSDGTGGVVGRMGEENGRVCVLRSPYSNGFGFAVRAGLERSHGTPSPS